jgi:hypothetical protein
MVRLPKFTADQRQGLLNLGLYQEQTEVLDETLTTICSLLARGGRIGDVRGRIHDLAKALNRAKSLFKSISSSRIDGAPEAYSRLLIAEHDLRVGTGALARSIEEANRIADYARANFPLRIFRIRGPTAFCVHKILWALQIGHCEHFSNRGEPVPPFGIRVTRKRAPFPDIVRIVSEASGGWSADDAIRAYPRWLRDVRAAQEVSRQRRGGIQARKNLR